MELFFLPWVDASDVYMCACALGCFYGHISTQTFGRVLTASVDSCAEIKSAPSVAYITKSGRVGRKVPESDARSVLLCLHAAGKVFFFFLLHILPPPPTPFFLMEVETLPFFFLGVHWHCEEFNLPATWADRFRWLGCIFVCQNNAMPPY